LARKWGLQKRKTFLPWQPEQTTLLPPSPREWVAEDHQVYFLLDLVDELDLSQVLIPAQSKDPRGESSRSSQGMNWVSLIHRISPESLPPKGRKKS
jgi:hypothetical protein